MNKTNYQIAIEVIAGKWGNGESRRKALWTAGYNPDAVQSIVNALLSDDPPDMEPIDSRMLEVEVDLDQYDGINLKIKKGGAI